MARLPPGARLHPHGPGGSVDAAAGCRRNTTTGKNRDSAQVRLATVLGLAAFSGGPLPLDFLVPEESSTLPAIGADRKPVAMVCAPATPQPARSTRPAFASGSRGQLD